MYIVRQRLRGQPSILREEPTRRCCLQRTLYLNPVLPHSCHLSLLPFFTSSYTHPPCFRPRQWQVLFIPALFPPSLPMFSNTPMDVSTTSESFAEFPGPAQEAFLASIYDTSGRYAKARRCVFSDDAGMHALSSDLTWSAAASAVGSSQPNCGQLAPTSGWATARSLGVSSGILGQNDYFLTDTEYSTLSLGMDCLTTSFFIPPYFTPLHGNTASNWGIVCY